MQLPSSSIKFPITLHIDVYQQQFHFFKYYQSVNYYRLINSGKSRNHPDQLYRLKTFYKRPPALSNNLFRYSKQTKWLLSYTNLQLLAMMVHFIISARDEINMMESKAITFEEYGRERAPLLLWFWFPSLLLSQLWCFPWSGPWVTLAQPFSYRVSQAVSVSLSGRNRLSLWFHLSPFQPPRCEPLVKC